MKLYLCGMRTRVIEYLILGWLNRNELYFFSVDTYFSLFICEFGLYEILHGFDFFSDSLNISRTSFYNRHERVKAGNLIGLKNV